MQAHCGVQISATYTAPAGSGIHSKWIETGENVHRRPPFYENKNSAFTPPGQVLSGIKQHKVLRCEVSTPHVARGLFVLLTPLQALPR